MIAALAAITAAGIVLPHALRHQRVAPVTAVVLWLSSLALRAIVCLLAAIYLLFFLPRTGLFVSLALWMCVGSVRDTRAARRLVAQHAVGLGPRNSVIVGGSDLLFAVAGLIRPRILVSAGALTSLDDDELAAGLDHEEGHIARRHRFVMLLAVGLRALCRAAAEAYASSRSTSNATRTVGPCATRTSESHWRA